MLVTNDFEPDQRVRKEARSLTEKGMHVSVICLNRLAHYPIGHRRVDGVDVYSVAVGSFIAGKALSYLRALMCFYKKAWRLAIATHTTRPITVIHCHDFDTCLLGWALKHACSVPMIYDIHDWYPSYFAANLCADSLRVLIHGFVGSLMRLYSSMRISRSYPELVEPSQRQS